ncbi:MULTISPECIES: VOC family protein [Ramlibacter]|uniref:Bleomycin resistance protein n=1 Tax=Ramlibacter pinisoli TaxID=2682844 RepID=A0A6N8IQC3_9BURK|nr:MULTISPECIES: VOC family protein [Ramlibacter]MBA2964081.1 VOC family protein [Ramlibacter sp. CGMCC 1.13660]MVQ29047.1 bleomycin resistance protein [Ramlibacter pinisoli]
MRVNFNLFCRDIEAQMAFYRDVLQLAERTELRSPLYRALAARDVEIGFNAPGAYELLGLGQRRPDQRGPAPVTGYATFMAESPAAVDGAAQRAAERGATVVKAPYRTYYGDWQVVLEDPEGNVFRVGAKAD